MTRRVRLCLAGYPAVCACLRLCRAPRCYFPVGVWQCAIEYSERYRFREMSALRGCVPWPIQLMLQTTDVYLNRRLRYRDASVNFLSTENDCRIEGIPIFALC